MQNDVADGALTFLEGMRLLAGAQSGCPVSMIQMIQKSWVYVEAAVGSKRFLKLREPETIAKKYCVTKQRCDLSANWC